MGMSKAWYAMTPEERSIKRKEYNDRYKAKNKQRVLDYNREYRKIHKERDREKKALRMVKSRAEKKQKAVDYMGNKCLDCQQSFPNCCYDFHHLDPTKKDLSLAHLVGSRSWERILVELEKCVMLCSNCHRVRHWKENLEKRKAHWKRLAFLFASSGAGFPSDAPLLLFCIPYTQPRTHPQIVYHIKTVLSRIIFQSFFNNWKEIG